MKFIFADALDMIDPGYDFLADRHAKNRKAYWTDKYPHEFFRDAPYDGILVSRGIVGDHKLSGKYSDSQAMRFRRVGAREFLRLLSAKHRRLSIFGDCGAFSYVEAEKPPYSPDEILEFYSDGGFTHGCSVDHIIFDFAPELTEGLKGGTRDARERFKITQEYARVFLKASKALGKRFKPLGVVQGWSPGSMAEAARNLERMGYDYIAIGGMVPLSSTSVHLCLKAIRSRIKWSTKLHLLGFAKAEQIGEFTDYGIESFDSTSPLIRAFKDARANYYVRGKNGSLDYYTAIRIPQATENTRFLRKAKEGKVSQEQLAGLERKALMDLRGYDRGEVGLDRAVTSVLAYNREFIWEDKSSSSHNESKLATIRQDLRRTLAEMPWKKCDCVVCRNAGIEVMIFRSSNRNKRRGFHNLAVYYAHLRRAL